MRTESFMVHMKQHRLLILHKTIVAACYNTRIRIFEIRIVDKKVQWLNDRASLITRCSDSDSV